MSRTCEGLKWQAEVCLIDSHELSMLRYAEVQLQHLPTSECIANFRTSFGTANGLGMQTATPLGQQGWTSIQHWWLQMPRQETKRWPAEFAPFLWKALVEKIITLVNAISKFLEFPWPVQFYVTEMFMQIVVAESQCWLDLWLTLSRGKAIRAMSLLLPRSLNLPKEPGAAASACLQELKGGTNLTTLICHFLDIHRQMSTSA